MLKDAGFLLILVTNQPDVGRGKTPLAFVERTNATLQETLGLDEVRACIHRPEDDCPCRKPKPGMLSEAAARLAIDLGASVMVGDRWSDIEAGRAAGCTTVLIDRGYGERTAESPDHIATDLLSAVPWIVASSTGNKGYSP
jgi:D-glycero-D-manno-heptose 1,7-bisphosphate phosphatase